MTRQTEQTPKLGKHPPSKPGSLSPCAFSPLEPAPTKAKTQPVKETPGHGKGRAHCTPPTLARSSQAPASKQMVPCLCLLCCLAVRALCPALEKARREQGKSEPSKSCKPCKIVQKRAPPIAIYGARVP